MERSIVISTIGFKPAG